MRVGPKKADISHSEGLISIQTTLVCVEQQREATPTDILLFRGWRDLPANKRKETHKEISTNFLKNKFFQL
jgi:hypothetical protein